MAVPAVRLLDTASGARRNSTRLGKFFIHNRKQTEEKNGDNCGLKTRDRLSHWKRQG